MTLKIINRYYTCVMQEYKDIKSFNIEYQEDNGKTCWIYIFEKSGKGYEIQYEPEIDVISVRE